MSGPSTTSAQSRDRSAPPVSLCLLTYKRANVLRRSIDSLLAQSFSDFELIINDDCSPDETAAVCEMYAERDPRVRYCRNDRNLRYAGNQNAAVARARGEFIAFIHDGDIYRSDMVAKWVAALRAHPTAGLVFNAIRVIEEHGIKGATFVHPYAALTNGQALGDEMLSQDDSPIFGIVMTRASALRSAGPFDESLPVLADVDMWLRLLLHHDAAYVPEPLYDVMPRERGHVNRGINWKIQKEFDAIHMANAARYDAALTLPRKNRYAAVTSRLRRKNAYLVLRCLASANIVNAAQGFSGMLAGRPIGTLYAG